MKIQGNIPANVEVANAWEDIYPTGESTNWVVGDWKGFIPNTSLRFVARDNGDPPAGAALAKHVSVKWFVHEPAHPAEWGTTKAPGVGHTLSILAGDGKFKLSFVDDNDKIICEVILDTPGDFAAWGPGVKHIWRPIERSTIVTIRWEPIAPAEGGDAEPAP